MMDYAGLFRASVHQGEPRWDGDAEVFVSLRHARLVLQDRLDGKRPHLPPRRLAFTPWGEPEIQPNTLPWIIPNVDKTASIELIPFTEDLCLADTLGFQYPADHAIVCVGPLNNIIIKRKDTP